MGDVLLSTGIAFGRNIVGIVLRPYETYRRIVARGTYGELGIILALLALYAFTARIQTVYVVFTYLVTVAAFWFVGRFLGATGKLAGFMVAWGYTLVPTLVWFLGTSVLYVLLPPPRTTRPEGLLFSFVYLLFSATLLYWKVTLAYLALRFGLRLDLGKITVVCAIALPLLLLYSIGMYRLGIFRIPFL